MLLKGTGSYKINFDRGGNMCGRYRKPLRVIFGGKDDQRKMYNSKRVKPLVKLNSK